MYLTQQYYSYAAWSRFFKRKFHNSRKFISFLIQMVANNVKWKGNDWNFLKYINLQHFDKQIYDFGSASNISGRIDETNLKQKVKRSEMTRMGTHNIEIWTAVKVTYCCLIDKAASEVVFHGETVLRKYDWIWKTTFRKCCMQDTWYSWENEERIWNMTFEHIILNTDYYFGRL